MIRIYSFETATAGADTVALVVIVVIAVVTAATGVMALVTVDTVMAPTVGILPDTVITIIAEAVAIKRKQLDIVITDSTLM